MDPYKHLYPVTPTGWRYNFPFLSEQNTKTNNTWSEKDTGDVGSAIGQARVEGVAGGLFGDVTRAADITIQTSKLGNIFEPGSYTETIKHFNPGGEESYKVEFTLSNTYQFRDIQKNWELCFILTYQNRPNRRSVSLLDPPVIYSATIPGVNQFMYSYISDLQIDNIGMSRYVTINGVQKLIPEAYKISFTLKSLLTPTQNLMLYAHANNQLEVDAK